MIKIRLIVILSVVFWELMKTNQNENVKTETRRNNLTDEFHVLKVRKFEIYTKFSRLLEFRIYDLFRI